MYTLILIQVIDLSNPEGSRKYTKGELVYAVYPGKSPLHFFKSSEKITDTSTFYPAMLVMVSRRGGLYDYTATVQFEGDADENGVTPLRIVPLRYIMRAQSAGK